MELLEASCYGDMDSIKSLLRSGVDVNYVHHGNGWSALHWAAKRNHLEAVELLLSNGANSALKTRDSKIPSDLASDNKVLTALNAPHKNSTESHTNSFIPSYIKYPPFVHKVDLSNTGNLSIQEESAATPLEYPKLKETEKNMTILKVKHHKDELFIEIDVYPSEINTFDDFVRILVNDLNIPSINDVSFIIKLPDTKLRRIEEVKRLKNYQELLVRTVS